MTSYEKMQKISLPVCHEGAATRFVSAHVPVDTNLDPSRPEARKKITCRFNGTNVTITNTELFDPFHQRYNVGRLVAVCPQHKLGHCGDGDAEGRSAGVAVPVLQFQNEFDSNAKARPGDNFSVTASQVRLIRRLTAINEEGSGTRPNSVRVSIGAGTGGAAVPVPENGNKTKISRPLSGAATRPKSAAANRPVSGKASGKTAGTPRTATGTAASTGTRSAKKTSDSPTSQKKTEKAATTNKTTDKTADKPTDKPGGAKDGKTRKTTAPGTGTKATPKTTAAKSNAHTPKSKAASTGKTVAIETKKKPKLEKDEEIKDKRLRTDEWQAGALLLFADDGRRAPLVVVVVVVVAQSRRRFEGGGGPRLL
eukprot:Selendium_serpulae@DN3454_c0_g1_i3.p1